jgi:AhpD family alkylhydroperoxidase
MPHEHPRLTSDDVKALAPKMYSSISAFASVARGPIEPELVELVNLRASQINGCAYCVQYHITNGLELGVPAAKLNLVVVWREAGIFTEREEAALAWTEAVTLVSENRLPEDLYSATKEHFSDAELAHLTGAICAINVWNRISISYRYAPEI